jgi:hypothetical protein
LNTTGEYAENTKRSNKSQPLRMTALSGLEYNWLNMLKREKIENVTAAQDDGFVGGLNTTGSIC